MRRHSRWLGAAASLLLLPAAALAMDVTFIGPIGDKAAVIAIDGGAPKTVKAGQSFSGVTVISVDKERATVEIEGKRRVLTRGQTYSPSAASGSAGSGPQTVTLHAGPGGHYAAEAMVNGISVRFIVDTGATLVTLPGPEAVRLGIDYRKGQLGTMQTAAGPTPAYKVRIDTVRIGAVELHNVEGVVIERGLPVGLLGMSFLNRMEIKQDAGKMVLTKRY